MKIFSLMVLLLSFDAYSQMLPPHQLEHITKEMIHSAYDRKPSSVLDPTPNLYPEEIFITRKKVVRDPSSLKRKSN